MFYRGNTRIAQAPWIVLIMCTLLLLPWLGETLFYSKGEPREAMVALAMLQSGDWVLPVNFGVDLPYKPPFMAWLIAIFALIFNGGEVTEYLSRLPSALSAIALVMCGFAWCRRIRGDRFAMIFSIVTLTCFEVFRAAMACRVDMVLTASMVIPLYLIYRIEERGDKRHRGADAALWSGTWALLSCAVLTKGPVGSLLPCCVAGVYLLLRGKRFIPVFFKMLGLALSALLVPAIWYYAAWKHGGDGFIYLVWEENIGRLTGTMSYESHEQPFWYNFITLIAGCLPWTVLCLMAVGGLRKILPPQPLKPAGLLSLVAVVVIVGFYCIPSSKRSVYILPAYPFVCYAIASIVDSPLARRPVRIFTWIVAILAIIAPIAFIVLQFVDIPRVSLASPHWYGWLMLSLPLLCGCAWIANRHSAVGHLLLTVWALYVAYIACIMPSVLNPRSDRQLLDSIPTEPGTEIVALPWGDGTAFRPYTLDYYLGDCVRDIPAIELLDSLPSGTVVLIPHDADTTGIAERASVRVLTERGCDFRRPVNIAVKY